MVASGQADLNAHVMSVTEGLGRQSSKTCLLARQQCGSGKRKSSGGQQNETLEVRQLWGGSRDISSPIHALAAPRREHLRRVGVDARSERVSSRRRYRGGLHPQGGHSPDPECLEQTRLMPKNGFNQKLPSRELEEDVHTSSGEQQVVARLGWANLGMCRADVTVRLSP